MTIAQLEPLPLRHLRRGKVREVYVVDDDRLLLVATDRVSAFDVVMSEAIPHKGAVPTQVTAWWLRQLEGDLHHHMVSADIDEIIAAVPALHGHRGALAGRAMLCRRTEVFPVECVPRLLCPGPRGRSTGRRERWRRTARAGSARETVTGRSGALQPRDEGRDRARREHHDRAYVGDRQLTWPPSSSA